jgi:hypothetical protein
MLDTVHWSWGSSDSIDYRLDNQNQGSTPGGGGGIFFFFYFATASRLVLGPIQSPNKWAPRAPSLGIKQLGHEADHSSPEVKNAWNYVSVPPYAFMTQWLVKYRDNFTLPLSPL